MDLGDLGAGLGLPVDNEAADLCTLDAVVEGLFNSLLPGECWERTFFSSGIVHSTGFEGSTGPPLSFLHFME